LIRYCTILCYVLLLHNAEAQNTSSVTGSRDTSFNLNNEFNRHLKKYLFIQLVSDSTIAAVKEERNITYCRIKERKLKLDIFHPVAEAEKKRTAILFIHGGGWRSGDKSMHHPLMQRLAAMGYVCITPEYRLSTEALYPAAVNDIKTAIRWMRKNAKRYNIDINRIAVAGHSAGGQLAALMGVSNDKKEFEGKGGYKKFSSVVNAVIDVDGTLSFVHAESSETKEPEKRGASAQWFGYTLAENREIFKQASPLTHAGSQCPPYLFFNSSVERMHAGQSDFIKILNENNTYTEVKTYTDAPHSFCFFRPWFNTMITDIDNFLKKIFTAK
jgi:pectinesterase